jgi:hypothetical protein
MSSLPPGEWGQLGNLLAFRGNPASLAARLDVLPRRLIVPLLLGLALSWPPSSSVLGHNAPLPAAATWRPTVAHSDAAGPRRRGKRGHRESEPERNRRPLGERQRCPTQNVPDPKRIAPVEGAAAAGVDGLLVPPRGWANSLGSGNTTRGRYDGGGHQLGASLLPLEIAPMSVRAKCPSARLAFELFSLRPLAQSIKLLVKCTNILC